MVSLSSTVRGLVSTKNTHIFLLTVSLLFFSCSDKKEGAATKSEVERTGPLFTLMTTGQSGVNFTNKLPPETLAMNHVTYPYLFNGTGVSVGDINNDGLPDLYFTTNFGHNKLFVNRGNLHFEEIGKAAGVQGAWGWSTGTTMVDINSDGLLDIYVCRSGNVPAEKRKNELFVNNGNLTFTESAAQYGLDDEAYGTQAVFFDQDRDGDLDLYLVNHPNKTLAGDEYARETKKRNPLTSDKLYRNDNGNYTDISAQAGLANNGIGYGLNAAVGDLNNDGWPDIYVTNDYSEHDYLYINNKKGGFEDQVMEATRHISIYSMGSDIADFNSDGLMDIMVVDMVAEDNYRIKTNMSGMSTKRFYESVEAGFHYQYMMNTLQMNNGNGTFSDVSQLSGLSSTDWSWAPLWADFDNDGLQDLLVTNGLRKDVRNNDYLKRKAEILGEMGKHKTGHNKFIMQLAKEAPEAPIQNYIFKNKGNYRFENKADVWGLTEKTFSNGAAYADLDNDGDLEIIVCNVDQPALIYKNNAAQSSNTNYVAL
ncbi:MAG: FG-GAP repeat domain-containing protein, partial [Marinirhabdus sp.]